MPIYEYQCEVCGHGFEIMQKLSDPVLVDCPDCKKSSLKKLISPVAFRLKGTGWYETDFKNSQKTKDSNSQHEENGNKADNPSAATDEKSSRNSDTVKEDTSHKKVSNSEHSSSENASKQD